MTAGHNITREAQPIADQWMLRCTCGWRKAVSLMDPSLKSVDDIRNAIEKTEAEHFAEAGVCTCEASCAPSCKGECGCLYCRDCYADHLSSPES